MNIAPLLTFVLFYCTASDDQSASGQVFAWSSRLLCWKSSSFSCGWTKLALILVLHHKVECFLMPWLASLTHGFTRLANRTLHGLLQKVRWTSRSFMVRHLLKKCQAVHEHQVSFWTTVAGWSTVLQSHCPPSKAAYFTQFGVLASLLHEQEGEPLREGNRNHFCDSLGYGFSNCVVVANKHIQTKYIQITWEWEENKRKQGVEETCLPNIGLSDHSANWAWTSLRHSVLKMVFPPPPFSTISVQTSSSSQVCARHRGPRERTSAAKVPLPEDAFRNVLALDGL